MKTKITEAELSKLSKASLSSNKSEYVWDTSQPGFGVYISPKGHVSYLLQKWVGGRGGKSVRTVLGRAPEMSLRQAREEAAKTGVAITGGLNPGKDKASRREGVRRLFRAKSVPELFSKYVSEEGKDTQYYSEALSTVTKLFPIPITQLTRGMIKSAIQHKKDKGERVAARQLYSALRPFLRWCVSTEEIPSSPLDYVQAPKPAPARDRTLSDEEIRLFLEAVPTMGYPFCHMYMLLLATGQRRTEVAEATVSEFDLEKAIWTIPSNRTKNGKTHIVDLSPLCLSIVEDALAKRPKDSPFLLSHTGKTPVSGFSKAKSILDGRIAGICQSKGDSSIPPWRIHDLRRTVVTKLAELGVLPDVADRLLNHSSGSMSGVKGVYQRYEFRKERKEAILLWADYLSEQTPIHRLDSVTPCLQSIPTNSP